MAETYSISYTATSITFTFNTTRAYYFRCFVRTPANVTVIDEWVGYHASGYSITLNGLDPETDYVCNAQYSLLDGSDGTWMGATSFTTSSVTRPSSFGWTTAKTKGTNFKLTATEWNNLTANINAVRAYKGLSSYSFTTAVKGNNFTASIYNQAVNAIKGISGYGTNLSTVSKGDDVTAKRLNDLVSAINSVT